MARAPESWIRIGVVAERELGAPLLEVAADHARAASLDNAEFLVADAQTHAFAVGSFDIRCTAAQLWHPMMGAPKPSMRSRKPVVGPTVAMSLCGAF